LLTPVLSTLGFAATVGYGSPNRSRCRTSAKALVASGRIGAELGEVVKIWRLTGAATMHYGHGGGPARIVSRELWVVLCMFVSFWHGNTIALVSEHPMVSLVD